MNCYKFYLHDVRPDLKMLMRQTHTTTFGDFVCGVDGFWVFFPTRPGGLNEFFLKAVLTFLEELNADRVADIERHIKSQEETT